jgi:hypothetical protein
VFVHALVTYRNRGGEKSLRKLEMRLLEAGVTVARTSDDLLRYHDKFMIKDRQEFFLLHSISLQSTLITVEALHWSR